MPSVLLKHSTDDLQTLSMCGQQIASGMVLDDREGCTAVGLKIAFYSFF